MHSLRNKGNRIRNIDEIHTADRLDLMQVPDQFDAIQQKYNKSYIMMKNGASDFTLKLFKNESNQMQQLLNSFSNTLACRLKYYTH